MVKLYETLAWRPILVGTYSLYLPALAERDGASLLHCLAGKDRTGVAAALVHLLLGVHHDDAMEDYLLTNVAGNIDRRIEAGAKHLRDGHPGIEDAALRALMGVHPEYLDTALGAIRDRHGSVEGYAEDVLGFTPEMREKLASRLVE
jgi:protein tyrosine/serine phosphatase